MTIEPTYFTCTLGQAESLGIRQPHGTINELLDHKAPQCSDAPAVGFADPSSTPWTSRVFTFSDIRKGSIRLAGILADKFPSLSSKRTTVALLCPSTPDFLFTWLALIRLGHAALLIAPQCAPSAIVALCEQCDTRLLLFDDSYTDLANEAASISNADARLDVQCLPFDTREIVDLPGGTKTQEESYHGHAVTEKDVAYLHHTSGTSTGIPKPIPQSHHAAVGVLPEFKTGTRSATFTTTPLYHGGVADFFRSCTSSALIWLFPGKSVPITASNIVKCLEVAQNFATKNHQATPVRYFSSVPYVLQMLESDERGLQYLREMDMVGVGGAALPVEVGNRLVSHKVNLLSRFGSAECGFLLSSHRDFDRDNEWQFLRKASDQESIHFEPQESGLSELVILKGWPHMAKHNREDGSYATADLFEPHAQIAGAWKYHSRADSQLTLITGKKFDPAPLEADIATSDLLDDAVIFGNGQPYPGILLFRSMKSRTLSDIDLVQAIWSLVDKLNQGSQDHAKISKGMLIVMPQLETPVEKSSKGTLLRGVAYDRFQTEISQAYEQASTDEDVPDDDLNEAVSKIVTSISHKKVTLNDDTDLFAAGIDSVAGMQIRSRIMALLPRDKRQLPMTLVEDCGSIGGLAQFVRSKRSGAEYSSEVDDFGHMQQLVDEYSKFVKPAQSTATAAEGETIVLTGATGALGAHILKQYQDTKAVRKIYCLVRGSDRHAATERVQKSLKQRHLGVLSPKVVVIPAHLGELDLGLDTATYEALAREATVIMHVAWSVNFRMRLKSFVKDNIAGVRNLIDLALSSSQERKPSFAFCSSVASVMNSAQEEIPEIVTRDVNTASALGYSQSKWVAEQICERAQMKKGLRVAIFRVGQLSGDTQHGVWNSSEAWPLMLSVTRELHCLPNLKDEILDWLPVDRAATALIQGASLLTSETCKDVEVYHVVNDNRGPRWTDMIAWLQAHEDIAVVSPAAWVQRLSKLQDAGSSHPALRLLSHWQNAFGHDDDNDTGISQNGYRSQVRTRKSFSTFNSKSRLPVLRQIEPVDEGYFGKLWTWIKMQM